MARIVVAQQWTPADYWALTVGEREAVITELIRIAQQQKH